MLTETTVRCWMISCSKVELASSWVWSGTCCSSIDRICPSWGSSSSFRSLTSISCRTIRSRRGTALSADTQAPHMASLRVWQTFLSCISSSKPIQLRRRHINARSLWTWIRVEGRLWHTFYGWFHRVTPAAGWWAEPAGWSSSETRSVAGAQQVWTMGPIAWIGLWGVPPPYCQAPPLTWTVTYRSYSQWDVVKYMQ